MSGFAQFLQSLLRKEQWLSWAFLLGGLLLAAVAYHQAQELLAREMDARMEARVHEAKFNVERQINGYTEVLRGLQAQFVARPGLSATGFRDVMRMLDLEKRLPGIQAAGFSPAGFMRRDHAGESTPDTFAVRYIEPREKNLRGIGVDHFLEPARRIAIEQARDTGRITNSGRVRLFIAPGNIDGVVFFLPVYQGGATPATLQERRARISGVVFLAIRLDETLRDVFGPELLRDLSIAIHEAAAPLGSRTEVYRSDAEADNPTSLRRTTFLPLDGSSWQLEARARPALFGGIQSWLAPLVAAVCILLSVAMFFFMQLVGRARQRSDARARSAEHSLASKEMQLAEITRVIDSVLWTIDLPQRSVHYVSPAVARVFGHPADAFYERPDLWTECIHPDDRAAVAASLDAAAEGSATVIEHRIARSDGQVRWVRFEAHPGGSHDGGARINAVCSDITLRREMEESLRRTNRALRAIHECDARIATAGNERELLQAICDVVVKAGYAMAWAGVPGDSAGQQIEPVAIAGSGQDYVSGLAESLSAGWHGMATIGEALRTRKPVVVNNFRSDARLARWRDKALHYGFNSKVALPLVDGSVALGVLNVYAAEEAAFDSEELALLCTLARRVATVLQALRQRSRYRFAEAALKLRERAIEASPNAIIITDANGPDFPVQYVNPAFEYMTGYSADEIVGRSLAVLHRGDRDQPGLAEIRSIIHGQRTGHATMRNYRKDGSLFWSEVHIAPVRDERGHVTHFVASKYDITETKRYEAELEFHASHDALTGLANQNLLHDRLKQAIAYASRYGEAFWVVFLDLDNFKEVNESLGHSVGDRLLKLVAMRLQAALRETDTVARHGGDKFVLLLPEHKGDRPRADIIQRVMETLAQPLGIDGHDFHVGCSIGIAAYPVDGEDAETLVKHAHIAMYRAKECGRNNFQFYTADLNERALARRKLEADLRHGLEHGEFVLHYQPQVWLQSGHIAGVEALVRWQHPVLGMVPPMQFIPLAEETGLIVPLGRWILQAACKQLMAWQAAGLDCPRVAVNLSARQFADRGLVQSISDILRDTGLPAHKLEVELTESLVMQDVDHTIGVLGELKARGVKVSVDDFGTGYSSLAYLKRFPIDVLKIDQSFVRDIGKGPDDAVIVDTVISLAHSLRLQVIAEGVETEAQMRYLRARGCEQGQGYLFSRPLPAEGAGALLEMENGTSGRRTARKTNLLPAEEESVDQ